MIFILLHFAVIIIYLFKKCYGSKKKYPYYSRILEIKDHITIEKKNIKLDKELSLFCNILEFLTKKAAKNTIVYYHGNHDEISFITSYFESKFYFVSEKNKNKNNVFFVKSLVYLPAKVDLLIVNSKNYILQKQLCASIKPDAALLKFNGAGEYFSGELYTRPYSSPNAATCWLQTDCREKQKYNFYHKILQKWQNNHRLSKYNYSAPHISGLDDCYDCWSFVKIISDYYVSEHNIQNKTIEKIISEVLDFFKINLLTEHHGFGKKNRERDSKSINFIKSNREVYTKTLTTVIKNPEPLKLRFLPKYPTEKKFYPFFHHDYCRGILLMCIEVIYSFETNVVLIKSNNPVIEKLLLLADYYSDKKIIIYTDLHLESNKPNLQITAFSNKPANIDCLFFTDERETHKLTCLFSQKYCFKDKRIFIVPWSDYIYSIDTVNKYDIVNKKRYNYFCRFVRQMNHLKPEGNYDFCYDCMAERLIVNYYNLITLKILNLPELIFEPPHGSRIQTEKLSWENARKIYIEKNK